MFNLPNQVEIKEELEKDMVEGKLSLYSGVRKTILKTLTGRSLLSVAAEKQFDKEFNRAVAKIQVDDWSANLNAPWE